MESESEHQLRKALEIERKKTLDLQEKIRVKEEETQQYVKQKIEIRAFFRCFWHVQRAKSQVKFLAKSIFLFRKSIF